MPPDHWETPRPPRILVIDDNPTVHDAFDGIFHWEAPNKELEADEAILFGAPKEGKTSKPGHELDHAMSGPDGIEKVRRAMEEKHPYQVAFVDIRMPGMDGVETIEQMWKVDKRIQTVICTAYADYKWKDLTERFGQTDRLLVLKKPFHDIEVLQLASTLARKWLLGIEAAVKYEQMEALVAQRTRKLIQSHQREHQRVRELDQTKLKCLFRLAQEFRGPLTLILNPVEEMINGTPLDRPKQELIHRNALSLLRLVEDSLLMRRLDMDDQRLDLQETDLVVFVRGMVQGFAEGARKRGLQIQFETDLERRKFQVDTARLEKVIFNLLAHALDVTGGLGSFFVRLSLENESAKIVIEVPEVQKPARALADDSGTGDSAWLNDEKIALLLSHELLRAMKGSLKIERPPVRDAQKSYGLRMIVAIPSLKHEPDPPAAARSETAQATNEPLADEKELPLILLVAENDEFRAFIREGLGSEYRFDEASTSKEVLSHALETVPDLIVVDFDREKNDAITLCAQLKQDEIASHIPIILLGAEASETSQLVALEAGVDDCLVKPFRLSFLKARVSNLLETRRKLHQHFQDLTTVQPREMASNQIDAEFLRRVVEVVEKNLTDYEFDVGSLAQKMALSRRQLFRKFKAIAGCTPNVYIRNIRLNHAAELLKESRLTVSEIIYAVGFSDPKHFRTVFRERFGVLPGDFAAEPKPR